MPEFIYLNDKVLESLDELRLRMETGTIWEAMRRAIFTYRYLARECQDEGLRIGLLDRDKTIVKEIILP